MRIPEMKQEYDLTLADFERHPVWVGVHNYDSDESWYEQSDEETFRPWTGPLPFAEERGFVLVAATFELADGSVYSGYCQSVRDDWDVPPAPMRKGDGTETKFESWSAMHGGTKLSLLSLQNPNIFLDGRPFDFHLRVPTRRKSAVQAFYAAIRKKPKDVFPVRFAAASGLAAGIISGKLDGFFYFPMGGEPFEIDTGESLLCDDERSSVTSEKSGLDGDLGQQSIVVAVKEAETSATEAVVPDLRQSSDLSLGDFERHPVWVRVQGLDEAKPWGKKFTFRPWAGSLPVAAENVCVYIRAIFVLRDGSEYPGFVRAVPENWADTIPPPIIFNGGGILQGKSPRVQFGGSPLAIIGEQLPCVFVAGKRFGFWCAIRDCDELSLPFYKAIGKGPEAIFPIRFRGEAGLATGIVTGELNGFYEMTWGGNHHPRIVR